jgi:hypothetical protein
MNQNYLHLTQRLSCMLKIDMLIDNLSDENNCKE